MNQIVYSQKTDPYFNVALEYELMKRHQKGTTLFLWRNCPSVFIGRSQNLYMECDCSYLQKESILPVRRLSGGGAVFQDEGNLNFTFISRSFDADMERFSGLIQKAVTALGISCSFTGRNDLLCGGRKFSGHAYYEEDGMLLYHGTLLCQTDMEKLCRSLTPSAVKLESKGISSVRSRVINLSEILPNLTVHRMAKQLVCQFAEEFGRIEKPDILPADETGIYVSQESVLKLKSRDWLYGQSPAWSIRLEKQFLKGLVSALVSVKDGRIEQIRIYTDTLEPIDWTDYENRLSGRWYDENEIFDELGRSMLS